MRTYSPLGFVLTVALALGLAACGGVDPAEDAANDVARAGENTVGKRTARFEVVFSAPEGNEELEGRCEGAVDLERKRYRLACRHTGEQAFDIEVVRIEAVEYARFRDSGDNEAKWQRSPVDADDEALTVLDPTSLMSLLRSATRKVEPLGPDEVRGVPTEHVRLTVDREEAKLDADDENGGPDTVPVEIWIDSDDVIRRVRFTEPPATVGTLEFFDFGVPVEIEPPAADEVIEMGEGGMRSSASSCATGDAAPLTEATVIRVVHEHGIGLRHDIGGCYDENDVAELINLRFDGPGAEAEQEAVRRREGVVLCSLRKSASADAARTVQRDGEHVEVSFALANFECTIYPEGETSEEQIRRLERAFAALARTLD